MIVNPEQETADEIVNLIDLPSLLKVEHFARGKVMLVEILVEENSKLIDETLITLAKNKYKISNLRRSKR